MTEPDVEVIRLGHKFSNPDDTKNCHGILLTGGEDIHPRFYNKESNYLNAPAQFEVERDAFEIQTLKRARENHLPVLGICRGLQLINCVAGGTLKQDLGELNDVHRRVSLEDKIHSIEIETATLLNRISHIGWGMVNSSHHQAIDKLGNRLRINCRAEDGTIEGIEASDAGLPFLLAVQWHPERMLDQKNPLSNNIKMAFLKSAKMKNHENC